MAKRRKKKDNTIYWVLGIGLLILVFVGGKSGWFKSTTSIYSGDSVAYSDENTANPENQENNNVNNPVLTCQQKAQNNNAFFIDPAPAYGCLQHANLDCQDKGQELSGWVLDGTCCYYTCQAPAPPEPTCTDSDNGLVADVFGTCSSTDTPYIEDYCFGGQLIEQTCNAQHACAENTVNCQALGMICDFGRCVQIQ